MDSFANTNVAYLKIHGEGAGVITDTAPAARNIADTLKAGQDVVFKDNAVRVVDSVTGSNLSTVATWNPDKTIPIIAKNLDTTTALKEVEARYIAALESPPLKEGATVHIDDIPKLEKAYREGTAGLNLIGAGAKKNVTVPIDTPINSQEFLKLIQQSKDDLANELSARGKLAPDQIAKIVNVRGSFLHSE